MLNALRMIRAAIILRSLVKNKEKGDPKHKKGTQRGPKSSKRSKRSQKARQKATCDVAMQCAPRGGGDISLTFSLAQDLSETLILLKK